MTTIPRMIGVVATPEAHVAHRAVAIAIITTWAQISTVRRS